MEQGVPHFLINAYFSAYAYLPEAPIVIIITVKATMKITITDIDTKIGPRSIDSFELVLHFSFARLVVDKLLICA
jgi:hypothetical protein